MPTIACQAHLKKACSKTLFILSLLSVHLLPATAQTPPALRVKTAYGELEGTFESGVRSFKGVPYAQPPVGDLRWKEPQPLRHWDSVRKAAAFGPRAMQLPLFGDMVFRSNGMSEDCLYLNIWTPATSSTAKLPVLVYFFGGGLEAGDGSEPRYDGQSMAQKGIVSITVNYRLTVFGFMAHPELTKESPHHASGNYGLLDQAAALRWVRENIAAFGGDPARVTIAGESAGSFSVSAQMASPLSKDLIAGAIGESGSLLGLKPPTPLAEAEQSGLRFAAKLGAKSLVELRAMSATDILQATSKPDTTHFGAIVDGYFFPRSPVSIFADGQQAKVPLLVGWNSEEGNYHAILGQSDVTKLNYEGAVQKLYGGNAPGILKYYNSLSDEYVMQVATDLASDRFIGFSTWRWSDMQSKTGERPVYRYKYAHPRPALRSATANGTAPAATVPAAEKHGAVHSSEIEYALGNLSTNLVYDWQPEDYRISGTMQAYFANFIKTGNPNGPGLPTWPVVQSGGPAAVMQIDVISSAETEKHRDRYLFLESTAVK